MSFWSIVGKCAIGLAAIGTVSMISLNRLHTKMKATYGMPRTEEERQRSLERYQALSQEAQAKQNPKPRKRRKAKVRRKANSLGKPRVRVQAKVKAQATTSQATTNQATTSQAKKPIARKSVSNPTPRKAAAHFQRSDMDFENSPIVYWATMRAIFLKKMEREKGESQQDFLDRVFDSYAKEGYSRKDALGKAYGIAGFTLQKRGLIKKGTKQATQKGHAWATKYLKDLGTAEVARRFKEYEKILKMAK